MTTGSKTIKTQWYPEKKLLTTEISGDVTIEDIDKWEEGLKHNLDKIESNSRFKIFINLYGFQAKDLDAHKKFRGIVPLTLAQYGWKVGYIDLFQEEARKISFSSTRGIRCVAAVHVHQDATKIDQYEEKFGRSTEHFYTDVKKAEEWIESLTV